jgi:sugar O-acyltransferase (sialic acid O-acetyltransferase NeuD family)
VNELVIFGAGGHAREVAQLVADVNRAYPGSWCLKGFLADAGVVAQQAKPLPAPLLGDAAWLQHNVRASVVVAVGNPAGRRAVVDRVRHIQPKVRFATLVHPFAWVAESVQLGQGTVVFAGACINVDTHIGDHTNINLGCTLSHDCSLGNFVNLGPGVHLAGGVRVDAAVDMGTGVSVRPNVQIGEYVTIGAGAVVVANIQPKCTVFGVPARDKKF